VTFGRRSRAVLELATNQDSNKDRRTLGYEAVATVEAVGIGVKTLSSGDRVLVSCITSCGACRFGREGRFTIDTFHKLSSSYLRHILQGRTIRHVELDLRKPL
jgi:threonine dehydrogenase-like Zn-dependent dehydrogenase